MQLEWGLDIADKLGLPSYLEASPMGKGLYERMGYQPVRRMDFDAREWGLGRDLPHYIMYRPVQIAN